MVLHLDPARVQPAAPDRRRAGGAAAVHARFRGQPDRRLGLGPLGGAADGYPGAPAARRGRGRGAGAPRGPHVRAQPRLERHAGRVGRARARPSGVLPLAADPQRAPLLAGRHARRRRTPRDGAPALA